MRVDACVPVGGERGGGEGDGGGWWGWVGGRRTTLSPHNHTNTGIYVIIHIL